MASLESVAQSRQFIARFHAEKALPVLDATTALEAHWKKSQPVSKGLLDCPSHVSAFRKLCALLGNKNKKSEGKSVAAQTRQLFFSSIAACLEHDPVMLTHVALREERALLFPAVQTSKSNRKPPTTIEIQSGMRDVQSIEATSRAMAIKTVIGLARRVADLAGSVLCSDVMGSLSAPRDRGEAPAMLSEAVRALASRGVSYEDAKKFCALIAVQTSHPCQPISEASWRVLSDITGALLAGVTGASSQEKSLETIQTGFARLLSMSADEHGHDLGPSLSTTEDGFYGHRLRLQSSLLYNDLQGKITAHMWAEQTLREVLGDVYGDVAYNDPHILALEDEFWDYDFDGRKPAPSDVMPDVIRDHGVRNAAAYGAMLDGLLAFFPKGPVGDVLKAKQTLEAAKKDHQKIDEALVLLRNLNRVHGRWIHPISHEPVFASTLVSLLASLRDATVRHGLTHGSQIREESEISLAATRAAVRQVGDLAVHDDAQAAHRWLCGFELSPLPGSEEEKQVVLFLRREIEQLVQQGGLTLGHRGQMDAWLHRIESMQPSPSGATGDRRAKMISLIQWLQAQRLEGADPQTIAQVVMSEFGNANGPVEFMAGAYVLAACGMKPELVCPLNEDIKNIDDFVITIKRIRDICGQWPFSELRVMFALSDTAKRSGALACRAALRRVSHDLAEFAEQNPSLKLNVFFGGGVCAGRTVRDSHDESGMAAIKMGLDSRLLATQIRETVQGFKEFLLRLAPPVRAQFVLMNIAARMSTVDAKNESKIALDVIWNDIAAVQEEAHKALLAGAWVPGLQELPPGWNAEKFARFHDLINLGTMPGVGSDRYTTRWNRAKAASGKPTPMDDRRAIGVQMAQRLLGPQYTVILGINAGLREVIAKDGLAAIRALLNPQSPSFDYAMADQLRIVARALMDMDWNVSDEAMRVLGDSDAGLPRAMAQTVYYGFKRDADDLLKTLVTLFEIEPQPGTDKQRLNTALGASFVRSYKTDKASSACIRTELVLWEGWRRVQTNIALASQALGKPRDVPKRADVIKYLVAAVKTVAALCPSAQHRMENLCSNIEHMSVHDSGEEGDASGFRTKTERIIDVLNIEGPYRQNAHFANDEAAREDLAVYAHVESSDLMKELPRLMISRLLTAFAGVVGPG